jgi:hypothetical protein
MAMSIVGLPTVFGGKTDNPLLSHFARVSTQTNPGDTCGMPLALKPSTQTPVPKVSPVLSLKNRINFVGYRGEKAFQAVEAERMATYITKTLPGRKVKPIGYIDFHSYSQMVLYPYAYDCSVLPRDAEDIAEAAWVMAKAAREVHGRYFNVDSACEGDHFNTNVPNPPNLETPLCTGN